MRGEPSTSSSMEEMAGQSAAEVHTGAVNTAGRDRQLPAADTANRRGDLSVDGISRENFKKEIREKFQDVFSVHKNRSVCEGFEHSNLGEYCDQIPTVGAMCSKKTEKFYEALGASEYVLNVIRKGHHPCLEGEIPSFKVRNNASYFRYQEFADAEIGRLIESGRVEVVNKRPKCVNPLSVAVHPHKLRLVLDCSILNDYIVVPSFKFEDHKVAVQKWLYVYLQHEGGLQSNPHRSQF